MTQKSFLFFVSELCPPGSVSETGLAPCRPCGRRTYQPQSQQRHCILCPGDNTTRTNGSSSLQDCIGNKSFFPEHNKPSRVPPQQNTVGTTKCLVVVVAVNEETHHLYNSLEQEMMFLMADGVCVAPCSVLAATEFPDHKLLAISHADVVLAFPSIVESRRSLNGDQCCRQDLPGTRHQSVQ